MGSGQIEFDGWEQLRLFPPSTIRVEVTAYLDGPTGSATVGFKVSDADSDDTIALGVDSPCDLELASTKALEHLATLIGRSLKSLSPF